MRFRKKSKRIAVIVLALLLIIAAGIFAFEMSKEKGAKTYDEKVAAFANENCLLEKGQIVFLGDSITAGYHLGVHYRNLNLETYNRGISGDTTDCLLMRLQTSLLDIAPSKIVLMIGTNDINMGRSAEEIAQNYGRILQLISSELPDAEVWCVSIIPQNNQYSAQAQKNNGCIQETNCEIECIAESYGYQYVNLYSRLTDKNGLLRRIYSTDGLHLGFLGYCVWTDVMKEHLR